MTCFRLKSGQPMSSHCKLKGIDYRIAYNRVNKGYSVDEAVEYAKQIQGRGASLNNCIHYLSDGQSLRSKCFENGVPHGACYSLINKNGLSKCFIETAFTEYFIHKTPYKVLIYFIFT